MRDLRLPLVAVGAALAVLLLAGCAASGGGSGPTSSGPTGATASTSAATDPPSAASATPPTSGSGATSTDWRSAVFPPASVKPTVVPPPVVPGGTAAPGSGLAPTAAVDPALDPYVAIARADLAGRLSVPAESIEVVAATLVTWPDASLGCPKPGMSYTQVPVDGSMIVLRAADKDYGYHAGGQEKPFLCQN